MPPLIQYLDDYLIMEQPGSPRCAHKVDTFLRVCELLGIAVVHDKLEGPSTSSLHYQNRNVLCCFIQLMSKGKTLQTIPHLHLQIYGVNLKYVVQRGRQRLHSAGRPVTAATTEN